MTGGTAKPPPQKEGLTSLARGMQRPRRRGLDLRPVSKARLPAAELFEQPAVAGQRSSQLPLDESLFNISQQSTAPTKKRKKMPFLRLPGYSKQHKVERGEKKRASRHGREGYQCCALAASAAADAIVTASRR